MQQASKLIDVDQRKQIEKAVADAEAIASCEIVPVIATSSGRYDRPEDIIGLWLAVVAAVMVWFLFPLQVKSPGSWEGTPVYVGVFTMVVGVVVAFAVGAIAGSRIAWLRRLFIPRQQMCDEVKSRAQAMFFDKRIHHTADANGLLIYVSLFERMSVVYADREVLEKIGQATLDELCHQLTAGLCQANRELASAICGVIAEAGSRLAVAMPREKGKTNEILDSLVLID